MTWISVKEKLPPLDQQVLVCDETEPTSINLGWRHEAESPAIRGCNIGYDGDSAIDPYISHWMPLPLHPSEAAEQRNAEADKQQVESSLRDGVIEETMRQRCMTAVQCILHDDETARGLDLAETAIRGLNRYPRHEV